MGKGKIRPLKHQLEYAVTANKAIGQSKHADKGQGKNGVRHDGRSYSYRAAEARIKLAKQFGEYMRDVYPEIKLAKDIKAEHINNFLKTKSGCSEYTLMTYASNLRSIVKAVEKTYHVDLNIKKNDIKVPEEQKTAVRTREMDEKDILRVHASFIPKSNGDRAMTISRCCGARAEEIVTLRKRDIYTKGDDLYIHLKGKGGRERDVRVVDKDQGRRLLELTEYMEDDQRVVPIKVDSIEKSLTRHLKSVGLKDKYENTGFHAMRKTWAQQVYDDYRKDHTKQQSIEYVNEQLGHGAERDVALLGRYVHNMH